MMDFDWAFHACTEGVPLAGMYECSFESVRARNLYNNHPGLANVYDEVREKIAKEEAQSFHLALPHFLWHFLPGIHLDPMVWALRKGKGRVCVDQLLCGERTCSSFTSLLLLLASHGPNTAGYRFLV